MTKKMLTEIELEKEAEQAPNSEIIDEIYSEIMEGECITPWCDTVQKIIKVN
jgi:hypothetical protein